MPDPDDEHNEFLVDDLVNDPVIADTQAPEARELTLEHAACMGFVAKAVDRRDQPKSVGLGDLGQCFRC
jgi:hypothetical protein